jgi:hypothetical protein
MRTQLGLIISVVMLAGGCEFFGNDDDDEVGDTGETGDGDGDGDPPPSQGFRVFPKFMLQDLPAVVTIDLDGVTPLPCELDQAAEGGYVCDAGSLSPNSVATVSVAKDGFESAARHPTVVFNQIIALEVHLAVEGGPTGVWGPCVVAGEFETCADLCGAYQSSCAVTSCATDQAEWPIATYETFADADCTTPVESVALACESSLPVGGTVGSLHCCCAS